LHIEEKHKKKPNPKPKPITFQTAAPHPVLIFSLEAAAHFTLLLPRLELPLTASTPFPPIFFS
jgi:hypothetical protein